MQVHAHDRSWEMRVLTIPATHPFITTWSRLEKVRNDYFNDYGCYKNTVSLCTMPEALNTFNGEVNSLVLDILGPSLEQLHIFINYYSESHFETEAFDLSRVCSLPKKILTHALLRLLHKCSPPTAGVALATTWSRI